MFVIFMQQIDFMFSANFVPDFIQVSQKETIFKWAWLQFDVDISMTCHGKRRSMEAFGFHNRDAWSMKQPQMWLCFSLDCCWQIEKGQSHWPDRAF